MRTVCHATLLLAPLSKSISILLNTFSNPYNSISFPDRCINSSGVLRYRIGSGWVSELTRGHGRENITEILDVTVGTAGGLPPSAGAMVDAEAKSKRIECGVPDLRSVAASVLARLHGSQVSTD